MNEKKIAAIFFRFRKNNKNPTTELIYKTPFELLIAVMLSAQATDKNVNKATARLFSVANTPDKILQLGTEKLKNYIKNIGLYNVKTNNVLNTCAKLINEFHGEVPKTREELESLPGVGRKTANVLLNTYFKQLTIAVDTHVFRVAKRIGLAKGTTPYAIETTLVKIIPKKYLLHAHHWLILHGRYTCTAKKPHCANCIIRDLCEYPYKTIDPNHSC